jgi:hypothetical protein
MSNDSINKTESNREGLINDTDQVTKLVGEFLNKSDNDDKSTAGAVARGQKFFARDDVIVALSKMQLSYKPEFKQGQSVNINTKTFKSTLLNQMASQAGTIMTKSVNQIDGRTIDFVEMIFGAFLRDPNITYSVKSLLLRLQIPLIKIALLDLKFFYNPKHSARHVLDTIAHIGIGIDDKNSTVYQTMELIVDQLLRGFSTNISTFNTALTSLSRLTNIEKKKQELNEVQTRQKIRQEHARQLVMTELQFHMIGKIIPKNVQPLILKYWSTLMFHACIRHGKESAQWKHSVIMLRRVVNSLQPINNEEAWLFLKGNYKQLVSGIRQALDETSQSKEHVFSAVELLNRTYESMLNDSPHQSKISHSIAPSADAFTDGDHVDESLLIAKQKIARLPAEVKPGVWFEVFDGDNRPIRRFKLSVIVLENARLVFVDRLGVKGIEKEADTFMAELSSGKSRMIADHSIFNHALSEVISSLAAAR